MLLKKIYPFNDRENVSIDESKLVFQYRCFAYVVPAIYIAIANLTAHVNNMYRELPVEEYCIDVRKLIFNHLNSIIFF